MVHHQFTKMLSILLYKYGIGIDINPLEYTLIENVHANAKFGTILTHLQYLLHEYSFFLVYSYWNKIQNVSVKFGIMPNLTLALTLPIKDVLSFFKWREK